MLLSMSCGSKLELHYPYMHLIDSWCLMIQHVPWLPNEVTDYDWADLLSGVILGWWLIWMIARFATRKPIQNLSEVSVWAGPADSAEPQESRHATLYARILHELEGEHLYRMPRLTISDMAYRLGTNDKYVSRAVNEHAGKSFIDLVNDYRIRHAKHLIRKYGRRGSSRRVALESGFGSVSSYHRVFRAATGMTPAEWLINAPDGVHDMRDAI